MMKGQLEIETRILRERIPELSELTDKEVQDLYNKYSSWRLKCTWIKGPDYLGFKQWATNTPIQLMIIDRQGPDRRDK